MSDELPLGTPDAQKPSRRKLTMKGASGAAALPAEHDTSFEVAASLDEQMSAPSDPLPDANTGWAFFVALGIGIACSFAGLSEVLALRLLGVFGPIFAVVGFALFGWQRRWAAWPDTRQRFADACYFLGFVLTMWALIIGFLPAGLSDTSEIDSRDVLRHFGMALGATAAGLIARILVLQARSASRASIEADLDRAARQVVAEAEQIGEALAAGRRQLVEAQAKAIADQQALAKAVLDTVNSQLAAALVPLTTTLAAAADTGSIRLGEAVKQLTEQMANHSEAIDSAGTAMTTAYADATAGAERIARLTNAGGEAVGALLRKLAVAAAGTQTQLVAAGTAAEDMAASGAVAASAIADLRTKLDAVRAALDADIAAIRGAPSAVEQIGSDTAAALALVEERISRALNSNAAHVDVELTRGATALSSSIDRFIAELASIGREEGVAP